MEKRTELCRIAKMLYERRLVSGTDGNISMRIKENTILITPFGVNNRRLEPPPLLELYMDRAVVSGIGKPSRLSETDLWIHPT